MTDKKPGQMTYVEHSAKIGLSFSMLMFDFLKHNPPWLQLPFMWRTSDGFGGPCPDDPLTLYLSLQFAADDNDSVIYVCSLEDVIDDLIDGLADTRETEIKVTDRDEQETCALVAARLRELADKLDAVCDIKKDQQR